MNKHTYVAIMAGGIGSRFWPMSRTDYPKQFLDILSTGKTLIQPTFERFAKLVPARKYLCSYLQRICGHCKRAIAGTAAENILGEPSEKILLPALPISPLSYCRKIRKHR